MDILWSVVKAIGCCILYAVTLLPAAVVYSATMVASKRYFFLDFFYGLAVTLGMILYACVSIFGNLMSPYIPGNEVKSE